jgi:hypothetical protein
VTTFNELTAKHNGWSFHEGTYACICGYHLDMPQALADMIVEEAVDELMIGHRHQERMKWFKEHGYAEISTHWATCVYCGCIVGWLDEHREVCP